MLQKNLSYPISSVFKTCIKVLETNEAEITEKDEKNGIIIAKIGVTLLSWGNTITINLKSKNNTTHLSIESVSNMVQLSWGVNDEYEEDLVKQISNSIKGK
jgi:hypothetical protein